MSDSDNKILDMLCTAMEMAEKSKDIYEKALGTCENAFGKEIFMILKEEETDHEEAIRRTYESLKTCKPIVEEAWSHCTLSTGEKPSRL